MDDDGIPQKDALEKLFNYMPNKKCVVGPFVLNKDDPEETAFKFPISVDN